MDNQTMRAKWSLRIVVLAIAFFLVVPILVVIPLSFTARSSYIFPPQEFSVKWYENFFTSSAWIHPFWDSLMIGLMSAALATIIGTAAALGIRRLAPRWRIMVLGFTLLPLIVPVVITGVGLYALFLEWGLVGTYPGFVLAHTLYVLPMVVVPVTASLSAFDPDLEKASATLGANKWATFGQVTLPAILPGVAAGAVFAFVQSWDEIVISIFVSTPSLTTLPVKMYNAVAADVDPTLAAVSSLIITVITLVIMAIFVFDILRRRKHVIS